MSFNFPDREKWLARRETSRKIPIARYVWISTDYVHAALDPNMSAKWVKRSKGRSATKAELQRIIDARREK